MDDLVTDMLQTIEFYKDEATRTESLRYGVYYSLCAICPVVGVEVKISFPRPMFHQPPLQTEARYGLRDIAGHYRLPAGLAPIDLQAYAEIMAHATRKEEISAEMMNGRFDELLAAITARNPKLEKLRLDPADADARYDALMGIASDFNVADIQHFLDTKKVDSLGDPSLEAFNKKIGNNFWMPWIPAPETLASMEQQFTYRGRFLKPLPQAPG